MGQAVGAAVWAFFASTAVTVVIVRTILVSIVLSLLARQLAPGEAKQMAPPVNVTVRSTVENRRLIFGTARAGGVVVFYGVSWDGVSTDPTVQLTTATKFLYYVVALTGHQVSAITDVWLDKIKIATAQIDGSTGAVTGTVFGTKLYIKKYLGTSAQTANSWLTTAFAVRGITSTYRLRGIAYLIVRMERDDTAFPNGAPTDVTALVSGALLYDPRLDSTNGGSGAHRVNDATTWAFSKNPILALRWYLTGGSVVNDVATPQVMYGLRELNSRIDDSYTIAAANSCEELLSGAVTTPDGDQGRFTCDLEVSTGEARRDVLAAMFATCGGRAVYVHGKWRLGVSIYDSPLYPFTEADLYGDIETVDTNDHATRANAIAGVFRDSGQAYTEQTTPFRTNSGYETQDGGERIPREIDLRGVTDRYRAQRLCEIELRRTRLMRTIKLIGALNLMKVAPGETFTLSYARYGWVNRVFRCVDKQFEYVAEAGRVVLTALTEDSTVYTDMVTASYITPNQIIPLQTYEVPDAPSSLVTVPQTDAILLRWTPSTMAGVVYEIEQSTSSTMSSPTVVYNGPDAQCYLDKTGTTVFYFRVRARKNGIYSPYSPATGGVPGAAAGVTVTLGGSASPGSLSSSTTSASQTTASTTVTATGGTAPYTYAWTWTIGGTSITINSATAATTSFTAASLTDGEVRTGTARCTITDNVAATKTVDVAVSITRISTLAASASPASLYTVAYTASITTPSTTVTPSGGTPGYTYAWSWLSGGSGIAINSPTAATTSFTGSGMARGDDFSGIARCVVTDSASHTVNVDVSVDIYRDSPF